MSEESASFYLPGDRERVLGLETKHSDLCRFHPSDQTDVDNLKVVLSSLEDLYLDALEKGECRSVGIGEDTALHRRLALLSRPAHSPSGAHHQESRVGGSLGAVLG